MPKTVSISDEILPGCRLVDLAVRGDQRGSLVAIEGGRDVPFAIARAYYVYGTKPGIDRGFHAHRALTQMAVAVAGGCTMELDDGWERASVRLDNPAMGLVIGPKVWHVMSQFTPDCVLLVLADAAYDEADYIRDYSTFRAMVE